MNNQYVPGFQMITESMSQVHMQFSMLQASISTSFNTASIITLDQQVSRLATTFGKCQKKAEEGIIDVPYKEVTNELEKTKGAQEKFNSMVDQANKKTGALANKVKESVKGFLSMENLKQSVEFAGNLVNASSTQKRAESGLQTAMQGEMGVSQAEVQTTLDTASMQQDLGVLTDQVQMAGAEQMATHLGTAQAMNTLIPAMNNLALDQYGLTVSSKEMADIGNIVGAAMKGETAQLEALGVSFSDAQKRALQSAGEQERAAMMSQMITDKVGNLNQEIANSPVGFMQQMKNAMNDVYESVGAKLSPAMTQMFERIREAIPQVKEAILSFTDMLLPVFNWLTTAALPPLIAGLSWLSEKISGIGTFVEENWEIIEPIVWGIVAAIGAFVVMMGILNVVQAISSVLSIAQGIGTFFATAAQLGLNAALAACPLVWIIGLIAILIGIFYAVVGMINQFAGTSLSATGLIAGAFGFLCAAVMNGFLIPMWNGIAAFINFFYNIFQGNTAAVQILFYDLALNVLGYIKNMASGIESLINKIPGIEVEITAGLDNLYQTLERASDKLKTESEWEEFVKPLEYKDYEKMIGSAYQGGAAFEDNVTSMFDVNSILDQPPGDEITAGIFDSNLDSNALGGAPIAANTSNIADNTGRMADSMEMSEDDLKYMRDLAEQDVINRFTTAELTVHMGGITNQVSSNMDLDGITNYLNDSINEMLETAAEGVY